MSLARRFFIVLLLLLPFPCAAEKVPARLIDQALALIDLHEDLRGFVEQISSDLKEIPVFQLLPPPEQERMLAVMQRQFQPAGIEAMIRAEIQARLNARQVKAFLRAYRTPLLARMRSLEREADQPAAQIEQQHFQAQLITNPPAPKRVAMLTRLDDATGGSAMMAEMLSTLARQLAQARGVGGQEEPGRYAQLVRDLRAYSVNMDLFIYRAVSDDDLEAYVRLHEAPDVRRFFQAMGPGVTKAIATSLQNFLNEMGGKLRAI